jgi:hypothetical protein
VREAHRGRCGRTSAQFSRSSEDVAGKLCDLFKQAQAGEIPDNEAMSAWP